MNEKVKALREKYRLSAIEFGQCARGVDALRRSENRSPDFWDDVAIFSAKKYPQSPEEQLAKAEWFSDCMKFIQKHGRRLIQADYLRSEESSVSFHEDLAVALVNARLADAPDSEGSLIDESSVLEKLEF